MSFQAMTWAALQPCKNAAQKLVLLMLANHANGHTGQCNPSHSRLAQECCMSVSSLKVQIKELEKAGLLTIIHKVKDGANLPNQYALNLEAVGQNLTGDGSESGYKPGIKPGKEPVVVTRDKVFLNFDDLNAGEKECYHWAMTQPYWSSSTSSIEHFKTIYAKPSAKGLRGQFDAHKKALQDDSGQTGH
ncbi:MAG: helix-turn-helix domain-containing protein, partial [Methylococcaceae bacterium]